MFGVLIESKAKRQRRSGGAALSVALHVAIVGAVTAFTVPKRAAARTRVEVVNVVAPTTPIPPEPVRRVLSTPAPARTDIPRLNIRIPVPTFTDHLPAIELRHGPPLDSLLLAQDGRGGPSGSGTGVARGLDLSHDADQGREWVGTEALMRVVKQIAPRYPETLRQLGIEGRVLAQFTVDTLGAVEPASITILASPHDLFSRAVRDALVNYRFRPAESNGRRVAALAQIPFEFSLRR